MADSVGDGVSIVANEDDLDRILSHSDAIIGSLDKLDGDASIECNGTTTIDLTDIDCSINANSLGVNNGLITPGVLNSAIDSHNPVGTLTTCAPCVNAVRPGSGLITVRAGVSSGQLVPAQTTIQVVRNPVQPNRLTPPQLCGPSTPVVNGRLPNTGSPSSIVTMLMRPAASGLGNVATQLRLGVGRSPGSAAVPASSVQVVNVGVANRSEQGTARLVAVTGGAMPAGVRFIQSSPQQAQLQPQQVIMHLSGTVGYLYFAELRNA